ncbi:hypothetical protein Salat_0317700 [Sesamum alatum]|uniref:Uncharacterized protein n=1 Tax=Sesamum alatum TaxID=300844 RepID=A0AAE1Z1V0_9LAMI|nr:hypothetical protein Salat_0317700 [Sesamum alatum]
MAEEECPNCPEESSWTFYIEGFNMRGDDDDDETPSLVSDAASSAVKINNRRSSADMGTLSLSLGFPPKYKNTTNSTMMRSLCKQTSFKKQKTKVIPAPAMDFDLEDTASSPVNSPKVSTSYMNDQFMNLQKGKGKMEYNPVSDHQLKRNSNFGKGTTTGGGRGVFAVDRDAAADAASPPTNYADFIKKRTFAPA